MRLLILTALSCLLLVNVAFSLDKKRDCKCRIGTNRIDPSSLPNRIIGGNNAAPHAYPWQVTLLKKETKPVPDNQRAKVPESEKTKLLNCGGAIINEDWILTAAHCIHDSIFHDTVIGYGDNDLVQIYNKKQFVKIRRAFFHDYYSQSTVTHDVGLIELDQPLKFSDSVQPACLGFDEKSIYDGALKISGHGSTVPVYVNKQTSQRTNVSISRFLKEADVYDDSNASGCSRKFHICLKNDRTQDSVCKGDSGGPIHYTKNGKSSIVGDPQLDDLQNWFLERVASFVSVGDEGSKFKICSGNSTYTRLSSEESWVKKTMKNAPLPYEYRVKSSDYCS